MAPPRTLEGKVAIVTGASRGIGKTIAYDLASRGARVAIAFTSDSSHEPAEELIARIESEAHSSATAIQCDLGDTDAPAQIVAATTRAFGAGIDILVNNAAIISSAPLDAITAEAFDRVHAVNVRGPLLLTQAVLPRLRRPGRIINIGSIGGRAGFAHTSAYASSKAALEGLTRVWATELGRDGTTVNAVNPGPIMTEGLDNIDPGLVARQRAATPVENRTGRPEEIAEIVAFLAEERSAWVSGQCISASGGHVMY